MAEHRSFAMLSEDVDRWINKITSLRSLYRICPPRHHVAYLFAYENMLMRLKKA